MPRAYLLRDRSWRGTDRAVVHCEVAGAAEAVNAR
jgi:hypothetical protein